MGQRSGKLFYLLPLLFSIGIEAGEIKGVVTDSATKESVGGAIVNARSSNLPAGANALTEENGGYSLPGLPAGTYTVTADYAGAKATKTITLGADDVVTLNLAVSLAQAVGETYTVTGTRLPSLAAASVSPVTTVNAAVIKQQGTTRIEDTLNAMPQVFAGQTSQVSNGSNGTATANLRGLGSARTLVLIDGRRVGPGNPNPFGPTVGDLNFIPTQLVDHVDLLTGGASAVYGADAVGGVVNFVMKKNFEGVQVNFDWSFFQHVQQEKYIQSIVAAQEAVSPRLFHVPGDVWNPNGPSIALTLGVNSPDGKGNVTAYATWRKDSPITQADYDYSACALASGNVEGFTCGGSGTSFPAWIGDYVVSGDSTILNDFTTTLYNYGPTNYYQRSDDRYNLGAFAHYELAPFADVYAQVMFLDDRSIAQVAPGGIFLGNRRINCDNPLLTPATYAALGCTGAFGTDTTTRTVLLGRRNVEGGGRQDDLHHAAYRVVTGLRGDLGTQWKYDAYAQYMQTMYDNTALNYFLNDRINRALIARDDGAGNIVCQSVIDGTDRACVPYSIFDETRPVTQAMLDYLQVPGLLISNAAERVVNASLTGDLGGYGLKMPWSAEGAAVGVGGEYRFQSVKSLADYAGSTGQLSGRGAARPPLDKSMEVWELFGELRLPLIQNVTLFKDLTAEAAYRFSHYSFNKDTHTYKVGGVWEFMNNMRFRGSFQRAVRTPSLGERFASGTVGIDGSTDPCAGLSMPDDAAMIAQCASITWGGYTGDGVQRPARTFTQAQIDAIAANTASQYNGYFYGNADLAPEEADTFAVGFYGEPEFISGLQFSVDYFQIQVNKSIGNIGGDVILNRCLDGDAASCALVQRDANGSLYRSTNGYVIDQTVNTGSFKTSGIDFMLDYMLDFKRFGYEKGNVTLGFVGTWLNDYTVMPDTTEPAYNCSGLYGTVCGSPNPAWRHKLRATWNTCFDLSLSAQWRYISGVDLDALSTQTALNNPRQQYLTDLRVGDRSYLDLYASYDLLDMFTFAAGVNNVIDTDPPIVGAGNAGTGNSSNGNTWPQIYDAMGRYFFLSGTAKF